MELYRVAEGQSLHWPAELGPFIADRDGPKGQGALKHRRRNPIVRGTAGYVVDAEAGLEREMFLVGQFDKLVRVEDKGAKPSPIDFKPAIVLLEEHARQAGHAPHGAASRGAVMAASAASAAERLAREERASRMPEAQAVR